MGYRRERRSARPQTQAVKWFKLVWVVALVLILLAHRIMRTVGNQRRPVAAATTNSNDSRGEQISPADKRALDRAIQNGSQRH